jgi:hypothetical protein
LAARKQECIKRLAGACHLCRESDYHVLDAHRIIPGRDGGKYSLSNGLCLCSNCHRRVEAGEIEILGRHLTSKGVYILHVKKDGKEDWIWPPQINSKD